MSYKLHIGCEYEIAVWRSVMSRLNTIFFEQLNRDLKRREYALPHLIVDAQALEQNLQYVTTQLRDAKQLQPRIVVKSLACLELLKIT